MRDSKQHHIRTFSAIEDYTVDLSDVHVFELLILPDKKDSETRASLLSFRLA